MLNGNPNRSAKAFAPQHLDQSPLQPGYENPAGYGTQRTAGQLAPQPVSRVGMLNSGIGAQVGNSPYAPDGATADNFRPHTGWGNNPNAMPTLIEQWAQTPEGHAFLSQPNRSVYNAGSGEYLDASNIRPQGFAYGGSAGPYTAGFTTPLPRAMQQQMQLAGTARPTMPPRTTGIRGY